MVIRTVEAVIDEQGNVRLLEPIQIPAARRALVTIVEERPGGRAHCSVSRRLLRTGTVRRRTKRGRAYSRCGSSGTLSLSQAER